MVSAVKAQPSSPPRQRALRTALTFLAFSSISLQTILYHQFRYDDASASQNSTIPTTSSSAGSYFPPKDGKIDTNYEIITTHFGWTSSNAAQFSRRKISAEFFSAVTSHPHYNATASWTELNAGVDGHGPDPSRRFVIFLDVDTCIENNYPTYGISWNQGDENKDIVVKGENWYSILDKSCKYIKRVASSPALLANPHSRLVLLDCGNGPFYNLKDMCGPQSNSRENEGGWGEDLLNNTQVIIAYYGMPKAYARDVDIGLPPPAIKSVQLQPHELLEFASCKEQRQYLFTFSGRGGFRRERLAKLNNFKDVYVRIRDPEKEMYWGRVNTSSLKKDTEDYRDMLRMSTFAGAPRGDCLFSYRFTEITSAGAVPVVYANDWLPPFASRVDMDRVINWTKCALFLKEGKFAEKTVDILREMSDEVKCEMKKCSFAFWNEFGSSREGWLKGILQWVNTEPGLVSGGELKL
eukprot:CAMPEP_0183717536 /NCGR_PEP_ID=MMETSP0737-20130205/11131_1 /TAXON_ID=385413 /ORGANISM="Thalassiosira miniscula, Strain CCMP1093" /LENGTH=465 /DNA_ID=CAMNT_0025947003 /DNA_START=127 /DNA_END=1524 /DNA_ORIENTATION=+